MGHTQDGPCAYGYGADTLCGPAFKPVRLAHDIYHRPRARRNPEARSHNTTHATAGAYHTHAVWSDPLSLATTHGVSFPAGTEMFHFPAYPPRQFVVPSHDGWRVPPFGHPGIKALLAAPPGLSRPHTSFIGPVCQGIHHTPFTTTPQPHKRSRERRRPQRIHARRHIITLHDHKTIQATNPKKTFEFIEITATPTTRKPQVLLASTIQFSNHHAPTTPPTRTTPATPRTTDGHEPHQNESWGGGPGTQKHAHTTPRHPERRRNQRSLPHQQPHTTTTTAAKGHTPAGRHRPE